MSKIIETEYGKITITNNAIAQLTGIASADTYGLVGMASKKLTDGIAELLGIENAQKGVAIEKADNDIIDIKLYIIVSYGTKISVVAENVIAKVKYQLKKKMNIEMGNIEIIVQGVKVNNE